MIGLMGISNDGTLVTPNGTRLFKVPNKLGMFIQRFQHWIAVKTHK